MSAALSRRAFLGQTAGLGLGLAIGAALGPATAAAAAQRPIACWGDSLTKGLGAQNMKMSAYPVRLANYAHRTVYNGGRGGERSGGIAARQEGVPARTTQRVTIPSTGYVDLNFADEVFVKAPVDGTLKSVGGTITRVGTIGTTHRFTRAAAGTATTVPVDTPFHATDGLAQRGSDTIIWAGHNDDYVRNRPLPYPTRSIEDNIAAMVAYTESPGNPSNYLVLSLLSGAGHGVGTTYYRRAILEVNVNLQASYGPDHYLDVHRYLVDQALADAGIEPTAQDLQDIDQDITPASLRAAHSSGHLDTTGYDVLARYIYDAYVSVRW